MLSAAQTSVRIAARRHRVCEQSVQNWRERLHPYRMVGGDGRQALIGQDLFLLTLATFINPTATTDEIAAFIASNGGGVYERQRIDEMVGEWHGEHINVPDFNKALGSP